MDLEYDNVELNQPDSSKPEVDKPDIDEANKPEMKNEPLEKKVCMHYAWSQTTVLNCTYIKQEGIFFLIDLFARYVLVGNRKN